MISLNRVDYFVVQGNTYGNLEQLRKVGARYDNGAKLWTVKIAAHPLNNSKQKKKLETMLNELEENGCRFTAWYLSGERA